MVFCFLNLAFFYFWYVQVLVFSGSAFETTPSCSKQSISQCATGLKGYGPVGVPTSPLGVDANCPGFSTDPTIYVQVRNHQIGYTRTSLGGTTHYLVPLSQVIGGVKWESVVFFIWILNVQILTSVTSVTKNLFIYKYCYE